MKQTEIGIIFKVRMKSAEHSFCGTSMTVTSERQDYVTKNLAKLAKTYTLGKKKLTASGSKMAM